MNTCYIFASAEGFDKNFKKENGDLVIAADAGFKNAEKFNISPDITVGDFDSLNYIPNNTEIIKHPVRKNDTDTMLAVKIGLERGYKRFVLFGSAGGRTDHFLANLQTLNFVAKNGGIAFLKGKDFTAVCIRNRKIHLKAEAKGNISVFASDGKCKKVNIANLLYELKDATLTPDFPLGVSNEFIGKKALIEVGDGTLLTIYNGEINLVET